MRGAVVDLERRGTTAHVNTEPLRRNVGGQCFVLALAGGRTLY
jgi:hypothetical protein